MGVITIPPIDRSSDLVPRRSGNRGDILIAQGIQPPVFTSPDKVVTPVVEGIVEPIINEVVSETVPAMIDGAIEEQVPPIVNEAIGEQVPTMIDNSIEEQVPPMIDASILSAIETTVAQMIEEKTAPFVYTTEKKAKGRTDDDYIIWGQKFLGSVTAAANTTVENILITGVPAAGRLIDAFGSWNWGTANGLSDGSLIGSANAGTYTTGFARRAAGTIGLESRSANARTNSPFEAFVDWTDGTKWYE